MNHQETFIALFVTHITLAVGVLALILALGMSSGELLIQSILFFLIWTRLRRRS